MFKWAFGAIIFIGAYQIPSAYAESTTQSDVCNGQKDLLETVIELRIEKDVTKQRVLDALIKPDSDDYEKSLARLVVNVTYDTFTRAELRNNPHDAMDTFYEACIEDDTY